MIILSESKLDNLSQYHKNFNIMECNFSNKSNLIQMQNV